jgi:hypothetical protein
VRRDRPPFRAEANLNFTIENTIDQRIEIRVLSERPAFDGRLALGLVTLTPQTPGHAETEQYLAQVVREQGAGR